MGLVRIEAHEIAAADVAGPGVAVEGDVRFAGEDGFTTLRRVRKKYPELPVLMWSSSDNLTYIARAMALGVPARVREGYEVPECVYAHAVASYVERGRRFRAELRRLG